MRSAFWSTPCKQFGKLELFLQCTKVGQKYKRERGGCHYLIAVIVNIIPTLLRYFTFSTVSNISLFVFFCRSRLHLGNRKSWCEM